MPWNPGELKRLRVSLGYSQEDLAARAGCTRVHVTRLENGIREPSIRLLEGLARALNVSILDLLTRNNETVTKQATKRIERAKTKTGT